MIKLLMGEVMIGNSWDDVLKEEYNKEYFKQINKYLDNEYKNNIIYPNRGNIYRALKLTSYNDVKVVILGQDPYHGENEANGLCFSVNNGVKIPPSLRNIFNELYDDIGIKRNNTDLSDWANQGILLLNTVLTVRKDTPFSHRGIGWEKFTDKIISLLNDKESPIIFILWGNAAIEKKKLITNKIHYIIESTHPSPLSYYRGFKGSKPFSEVNNILKSVNKDEIKW